MKKITAPLILVLMLCLIGCKKEDSGHSHSPRSEIKAPQQDNIKINFPFGWFPLSTISMGVNHSCAVFSDGKVKCWGNQHYGKLGNGRDQSDEISSSFPSAVKSVDGDSDLSNIIQINSGRNHSCALTDEGTLKCWGKANHGALGNGDTTSSLSNIPVNVTSTNMSNVIQMSAGNNHSCAITQAGEAWCWGQGYRGQLGNGAKDTQGSPVQVKAPTGNDNLEGIIQIDTEDNHTCALNKEKKVFCWGYGYHGQLGNGSSSDKERPLLVSNISDAVQVATGGDHTCALLENGTISCWGRQSSGQLGNDSFSNSIQATAFQVQASDGGDLSGIVQITAGGNHTCALSNKGQVYCWGKILTGNWASTIHILRKDLLYCIILPISL